MADLFDTAVHMASSILSTYRAKHGPAPFPVIKDRLLPLIEARAAKNGVDNLYVKRFKETMRPIVGQMRRIRESNGAYQSVEEHGVIYLCPSLDLDWQRFILVKEASHLLLDTPDDYVHSETDIDRLMVCLAQFGDRGVTKQYVSENRAVVCAIDLLFPKEARDALRAAYESGELSPSAIAKAARFPVDYVRFAMGEWYTEKTNEVYDRIASEAASPALDLRGAAEAAE